MKMRMMKRAAPYTTTHLTNFAPPNAWVKLWANQIIRERSGLQKIAHQLQRSLNAGLAR